MFKCVIATFDTILSDRLTSALDGLASVVRADPELVLLRDAVSHARPDLVLIDIDMTGIPMDLAAIVLALRKVDPDHLVIAIGDEGAAQSVLMAIRAGTRDFIDRDGTVEQLRGSVASY